MCWAIPLSNRQEEQEKTRLATAWVLHDSERMELINRQELQEKLRAYLAHTIRGAGKEKKEIHATWRRRETVREKSGRRGESKDYCLMRLLLLPLEMWGCKREVHCTNSSWSRIIWIKMVRRGNSRRRHETRKIEFLTSFSPVKTAEYDN